MDRVASTSDLVVPVDGIGTFTFAKRMMRDQFRIQAEFARLTEGVEPVPDDLELAASAVAGLKILTVSAPDEWDIDKMDPLDDDTYDKLLKVFSALRAAEEKFRARGKKSGQGDRTAAGADAGVLVSPEVQPGADRPAIP